MNILRNVFLFLLVTIVGCGQQLVEFPLADPPTVLLTAPMDGTLGVGPDTVVRAVFSKGMAPSSLDSTTFTLKQGEALLPAAVGYAGLTATLTPASPLPAGAVLTATITTGATDADGTALAANYTWSFTTRDPADTTAPTVRFTDPADGDIAVASNIQINAAFSEAMRPDSLDGASFTVKQGDMMIPGAVSYSGLSVTFVPANPLAASALVTATIGVGAEDLAGNALAAPYVWSFTTSPLPDVTSPAVTFTDPADMATGVDGGVKIQVAFNETMDCATLDVTTFTVMQGALPVLGAVSCNGPTATFTPLAALNSNAVYTATISTGAHDPKGNALLQDYVWSFSTSPLPDLTSPAVTFTDPTDMATGVDSGVKIHVAFNETMDCATLDAVTFTLMQGVVPVLGAVSCNGPTATFTPLAPLNSNAVYTATMSKGAHDLAGNALLQDHVWSFSTSPLPDVASPAVTFTDPADMAKGVDSGVKIHVAFNEAMDCATLDVTTFTVKQGLLPVLGAVSCNGPTATFTPLAPLTGDPTYTATISTGARDLAGNALLQNYVWSFETGAQAGLAPVLLGDASSYAILAFNTVTNVNNPGTMVTGDLGISPGAALVGFPPGQVVGAVHAGDPIAAAAKASLLAAYNDAAGRLNPAVLPADLSGLTFAPGLYANATSVMISSGNLTLDAKGNANAVFIFQVGSTLTTNAATQVILAGSAKATNVFWAVGTSATLGTNSIFKGTVLAATAITMNTGAVLEGRLLAQGAAVSLDTNVITVPAP